MPYTSIGPFSDFPKPKGEIFPSPFRMKIEARPLGHSYAKLDVLFEDGTLARKFKTTAVDLYAPGSIRK